MAWVGLGIVVIVVLYVIATYNGLVKLRNWVKESWSQIDVQLKRRHDLIPNLVETVKGYAKHEQETLEKIIQARNQMLNGTPNERIEADNQLQSALKSIFALGEAYPDLKANQNFLRLQEELTNSENKVAYSRQLYNKTVAEYNIKRESFPSNIIAGMFSFKEEQLLTIPEAEKAVPKVSF
ncbi:MULTISPECIES: LemA family protein [unclassified Paenibacillus]|uniref:LemA family protein n=1 Tax=unclassified Paenibacillus TaxID=185978 RepID=UPI001AE82CC4|nr:MULTISPECIES: LemA family protein [unclassified Paenibacillus]MBP1157381.1 LemA protein [Paenibacillus sp. PvP091]MBP1171881.1 LemA protein [Paenibacillus sp. PvR098]MBP2438262.1 LemA protein [Paenibacillus sp. PvP052]